MPHEQRSRLLDPPAQAERTALAWQRTGLGLLGIGALLAHTNEEGSVWRLTPGLAVLAVGVFVLLVGTRVRYRRITAHVAVGENPVAPRTMAALAVLVSITPVLATVLLIT